jgi:hypothetical protein
MPRRVRRTPAGRADAWIGPARRRRLAAPRPAAATGCDPGSQGGVRMADGGFHTVRDQARPELLWFLRHRDALGRWPVIAEEWAHRVEARREAEENRARRDITYLHGAGR